MKTKGFWVLGQNISRRNLIGWSIPLVVFLTVGFGFNSCGTVVPETDGQFDLRFYNYGGNLGTVVKITAQDSRTGFIYVGGDFYAMNNLEAHNIAVYDPVADVWSPLANGGLNDEVEALTISGNYLYVGGRFTQTSDGATTGLDHIARYNLDTRTWSPLPGGGVDKSVFALAISGNDLFVGGDYTIGSKNDPTKAGNNLTTQLNALARYNLATDSWSAFTGNGLNGPVYQFVIAGDDLYVGGTYYQTFDHTITNIDSIARYNLTTDTWSPLAHNGLNGTVEAVVMTGDLLYIGGFFSTTGDFAVPNLNNIARYNLATNTWSTFSGNGLDSIVYAMTLVGDQLYVGGAFTKTFNGAVTDLSKIARYDTTSSTWTPLGGNGLNEYVETLAKYGNYLYVGGGFDAVTEINRNDLNGILRYQLSSSLSAAKSAPAVESLAPLGFGNGLALDNSVNALAVDANGFVYAGGFFRKTANGATTDLNFIARYDPATKTWSPLANAGLNNGVTSLAIIGDNLYVGGSFTRSGDNLVANLNRIARYNLTAEAWFPMPGNGLNSSVGALAASGSDLYVGGAFARTFNSSVLNLNRIARFDTAANSWSPLADNGLNNNVNALATTGGELFAGGLFSQSFGGATTNLNRIARYNISTGSWSPLANNGLNDLVGRMTAADGFLYLRGSFTQTFDGAANLDLLARYDPGTNSWAALTGSPEARTAALLSNATVQSGSELYVGGGFSGVPSYFTRIYLQKWNVPAPTSDWFDDANWATGLAPAADSNAVIPTGAGQIDIASADVVMNDLNLNGGTVNIGANRTLTINGILSLNGGGVTGAGTLIIASCQPDGIMGGSAASHIQTALVRCVDGTGAFNFPVGTANGYSPVTIGNISGTGNVAVRANQGAYAGPAAGLPAARLARWWQIDNPGGGIAGADLYFNYAQADVSGVEENYRAFRISGGAATMTAGAANAFANRVSAAGVTGFSDWTLAPLAPTAARVTVGGRVTANGRRGVAGVVLTLTAPDGTRRSVRTNSFGYYRFDELTAGETYVIAAGHKRYSFKPASLIVTPGDDLADVDFDSGGEK